MKKILAFLAVALLAMPLAASAWTPDGDVTVIVAYKAGSGTDTGARLLASQAEKYLGKTLACPAFPPPWAWRCCCPSPSAWIRPRA